jgi:hypothetical protein
MVFDVTVQRRHVGTDATPTTATKTTTCTFDMLIQPVQVTPKSILDNS